MGSLARAVLRLCETAGIVTREQPFSVDDVHTADEAFVTGTFGGLTPVRSVDGHDLPVPGPVTARLTELYARGRGRGHRLMRIHLWSGPRNVSTALMYSFRSRSDMTVVDEPLYGHYLEVTGVGHPADREVIDAMECDATRVVATMEGEYPTPHVLFKQMAHHLIEMDRGFLGRAANVILTRDPTDMLPSLAVQLPEPTVWGTSLPAQVEILDMMERQGSEPLVLDAALLLADPASVLRQLCDRLGVPWDEAMLTWEPGPKPEDGVWAPHWYHRVHESTGFVPYEPKTDPFPDRLRSLLDECLPLYARLQAVAIRP